MNVTNEPLDWCEAHHLRAWSDGGATDLDNPHLTSWEKRKLSERLDGSADADTSMIDYKRDASAGDVRICR